MARVAVLASGQGTNLQALMDDPVVGPWVVLVVSDRTNAFALDRARTRNVKAVFLDPAAHADRAAYDQALRDLLESERIDCVALAGFMRIVGPEVVDAFRGRISGPIDPELDQLTAREQEVLRHIARGFTYKEVGRRLHLSVKTVETHVSSVLRKLQLSSRYELTRWATDRRLV